MLEDEKIQYWVNRWETDNTSWHKDEVNPELIRHSSKLFFKTPATVLLPLCGKSLDLEWIYNQGHNVIGVEATEFAIDQFFKERDIPHKKLQVEVQGKSFTKYQSLDERLTVFLGNIFALPPEILGKVDGVWDRGSLVAIHKEDRMRYSLFIKSIVSENFRILLDAIEYDETLFDGPPRVITKETVDALYGSFCNYEILEEVDRSEDAYKKNPNLKWFKSVVYLFTPKR